MHATAEQVQQPGPEQDDLLDRIRGYAWRVARHKGLSTDQAHDAAQEAVLNVWRVLHKLEPGRDPWPFCATVAAQKVVSYWYRLPRRDIPVGELPDVDGTTPHWDSTEEQGCAAWESERVRLAVAQLKPNQRKVIECLFYEGLSQVETAQVMGWKVWQRPGWGQGESSRVKQVRRNALDALAAMLGDDR